MPPPTELIPDQKPIKGIPYPANTRFRQLLVTGPPGAGKSSLIRKLGGWSEEGYLDLTQKNWWSGQALAIRPREIHLGFPFKGFEQALAVFDKEWLKARPELEPERILVPPVKKHFWSVDWRGRYVFEFVLPPAETIYGWRMARARKGTHPVDATLSLELVQQQVAVFWDTALVLHRHGLSVILRPDPDSPSRRFPAEPGPD